MHPKAMRQTVMKHKYENIYLQWRCMETNKFSTQLNSAGTFGFIREWKRNESIQTQKWKDRENIFVSSAPSTSLHWLKHSLQTFQRVSGLTKETNRTKEHEKPKKKTKNYSYSMVVKLNFRATITSFIVVMICVACMRNELRTYSLHFFGHF